MTTMLDTIVPKSDQLNADDLIGRTLTITVTKVVFTGEEQPVAVHFDGDNGKPYKPSMGMRRVMVHIWGEDANAYIGKSLTLYRDDKVSYGGFATSGVRISHISGIDSPVTMALTESKKKRKPFTVHPLHVSGTIMAQAPPPGWESAKGGASQSGMDKRAEVYAAVTAAPKLTITEWLDTLKVDLESAKTDAEVSDILARPDVQKATTSFKGAAQELLTAMITIARRRVELPPLEAEDDGWPGPRPEDSRKGAAAADDLDDSIPF